MPFGRVMDVGAAVRSTCCSNPVSVAEPTELGPLSPIFAGEPVTGMEVEPDIAVTFSVSDSVDGVDAAPIVMVQEPNANELARVAHVPASFPSWSSR